MTLATQVKKGILSANINNSEDFVKACAHAQRRDYEVQGSKVRVGADVKRLTSQVTPRRGRRVNDEALN